MVNEPDLLLLKYLAEVFDLEKTIYSTRNIIREITQKIPSLGISKQHTIPKPEVPIKLNEDGPTFGSCLGVFGSSFLWPFLNFGITAGIFIFMIFVGGWLVDKVTNGSMGMRGTLLFVVVFTYVGGIIILTTCTIFDKKKIALANKNINQDNKKQYPLFVKKYEQLIQADKDRVSRENSTKKYFLSEIERFSKFISDTQKTLEALYNLNVIYPKYRHYVAVAMFCEYIQSGRCTDLIGAHGAYNLYEEELRSNIIIESLKEIIKVLNNIRESQYLIYQAITESNRLSNETNRQLDKIQQDLIAGQQSVKASSELAAYYAKETAKNSKILVDLNRDEFYILKTKYGRMING